MADITDERLREIASRGFRACGTPTEKAQLAAELLAARARIAKLEQEPPMAMVDFGVGVNWKGLSEDRQRLRAERDAALKRIVELDEVRAAQGELLSKLPPSADQLVMAEMDAAVARTERAAARADLREAIRLLGEAWSEGAGDASWSRETFALLAKHKEATDG